MTEPIRGEGPAPHEHQLDRAALVRRTVRQWINELIDLGGRNNLLHYRDLKAGTLDLGTADGDAVAALLKGRTTQLSRIFIDQEPRKDAIRRVRTIYKKAKENYEERGISTLYLACGIATWSNVRTWTPAAPVLLIAAQLEPMGAALDDFSLSVDGDPELNPTLLHVLKVDYDCDINPESLLEVVDGPIDERWEVDAASDWLTKQAQRVPAFAVTDRFVLANFSYAKLPMVHDLENSEEQLVAHDMIAALAGDAEAREAIRSVGPSADALPSAEPPAADEFLVLDADSTQSYAINSVLGGQHLIVRGPPGTGKSQSIANLIGSLVARGKRVLFVAEKRAAIDAVLKRLRSNGLDELVLDLHGRVISRKAFAEEIARALYSSRSAPRIDRSKEERRLERRRTELNAYERSLHTLREPWNLSVYEIQADLLGIGEDRRFTTRLRGPVLDRFFGVTAEEAASDLDEYASVGGFSIARSATPWSVSPIATAADATEAYELLDEIQATTLPAVINDFASASDDSGVPEPQTLDEAERLISLWTAAASTAENFSPGIYGEELESLTQTIRGASQTWISRWTAPLFSHAYRQARSTLRLHSRIAKQPDQALITAASTALGTRTLWQEVATEMPSAPVSLPELVATLDRLRHQLRELEQHSGRALTDVTLGGISQKLAWLAGDRSTLAKLPTLARLRSNLTKAGLADLMAEIDAQPDPEGTARQALEWVWLQSILDRVLLTDPAIGSATGVTLDRAVDDFVVQDHEHIETNADRIRRIAAELATIARDTYPDQAQLVQRQASLKRRHMPVRTLVHNAADVLLALKPCWAMSPLMVSQLLPTRKYFDVVVFDEASQVTPADAATSILRGDQLVVAGDEKQLPPTSFFSTEASGDVEEEYSDEDAMQMALSGTEGFESILDTLNSLVPARMLQWHYRSRDERLIAFSNAYVYDKMLTTFPGTGGDRCLDHVPVDWEPGADTNSPAAEVRRTVDLILEHAANRPNESLGVISMGIKHSTRIDEGLRQRLAGMPELNEFFLDDREEPFFVKNLERVQGDERDAIILTIGYGKNERGQMAYRFGPLLTTGGERRLNVAVTRAKRRITLVTSFSSGDLDPERLNSEGMQLLRSYVIYAESGGSNLGERALTIPALNPFEVDVRDALVAHGIRVIPQYGASGYRIDFAVQHPDQPGRFILAIECDGASFHSAETARDRDRLRQEQLERIGWRFHRIWSSEWFHNKELALEKVLSAYNAALNGDAVQSRDSIVERILDQAAVALPPSMPEAHGTARVRGPRPDVSPGWKIHEYWDHDLVALMQWIESDDLLRTEDELIDEAMRELGFHRHGVNIVYTLRAAVRRARSGKSPRA